MQWGDQVGAYMTASGKLVGRSFINWNWLKNSWAKGWTLGNTHSAVSKGRHTPQSRLKGMKQTKQKSPACLEKLNADNVDDKRPIRISRSKQLRDSTQTFPWSNSFSWRFRLGLQSSCVVLRSCWEMQVRTPSNGRKKNVKIRRIWVEPNKPLISSAAIWPSQSRCDVSFTVSDTFQSGSWLTHWRSASMQKQQENKARASLSHLHGHFNQHEQLFYADPQTLTFHSFTYAGPLYVLKTAQQLWGEDIERRALSVVNTLNKHP